MTQPRAKLHLALVCLISILFFWDKGATGQTLEISSDPFTNSSSQHMTEVEPHIFANGSTIVATFQQGRIPGGGCSDIGFTTSLNSGATWQAGSLPGLTTFFGEGGRYNSVSDPSVAYNVAFGVWIIESLPVGSSGNPELFVSRSTDGLNWDNPVTVAFLSGSFFDKPWITCDNTPTSPFFGNCYIEWDDVGHGGYVLMSTSTDGGATWGPPLTTADTATGLGGQPLVQPSGRVVVPFSNFGGNIRAFISDDGGNSWSTQVTVSNVQEHFVAGGLREPDLPSAAIDGDGTIYVAWDDCRFRTSCRSNDIVISTSSDGLTWSSAIRVPIDDTGSTADHFLPGIGADRNTFAPNVSLALVYYYYPIASCSSATCQLIGGFITSPDGGGSWSTAVDVTSPMTLNWLANTSQGRMVGDYMATYFTDDGVPHPVFASATMPDGQFHEAMDSTCIACNASPMSVGSAMAAPGLVAESEQETPVVSGDFDITVEGNETNLAYRAPVRVNIGTSIPLQASGAGIQNAAVQWSVEEGPSGGVVNNLGVYTPPLIPGVYHVLASSGTKHARLTVRVFSVT